MAYPIHEIFETLQGEGRNTGRRCVFIRFSGCNLACPWCDTDFSPRERLDVEEILRRLEQYETRAVILTGGEPLLQPLLPLLSALKAKGYWIAIETNGTINPPPEVRAALDYIATSPKEGAPLNLTAADEVRLVVTPTLTAEDCLRIRKVLPATDYFLSPCDTPEGFLLRPTLELLGQLNRDASAASPWRLSLQTHKLAGIP